MFTESDREFLARLATRADAVLAGADSAEHRLRTAIDVVRSALGSSVHPDTARVDALLDNVWWAAEAHDAARARAEAAQLSRVVRGLDLPGLTRMRALDAVLEIRSLVVLAA